MERFTSSFKSLFDINMGTKNGERIVVFSDLIRADESPTESDSSRRQRLHGTAIAVANYGQLNFGNCTFTDFQATAASGTEPPIKLWTVVFGETIVSELNRELLLEKIINKNASENNITRAREIITEHKADVADVIIAMANNSTSHTRFRALANNAGARFASLPHFEPEMFLTSMAIDWRSLKERTDNLASLVNRAFTLHLTTPDGTNLKFSKGARYAKGDDGMLTSAGSFGNLPAGEVYFAPLEGLTEGVMRIGFAPTRTIEPPLLVTVKNGEAVSIEGSDTHRQWLEQKFSENRKNRNIAELGIGTNDRATRPDNVLEAEKILGTVHVAFGDNSGFGGKVSTPFHEDYVLYCPTLTGFTADGESFNIISDGILMPPA